ncbi:MAG: hypothetical protein KC586_08685, partial [Myxococcales bacterium]|nr:hypothetical protein [Myxococcales bacterium]
ERDLPARYAWPGNVRELEQAIRRVLLTGRCAPDGPPRPRDGFWDDARAGTLDAESLLRGYCAQLFAAHGSYVEVARRTGLDRRTVAKHVTAWTDGVERHASKET